MKKISLIIFCLGILFQFSAAQKPGEKRASKAPEERAKLQTEKLTEELGLNETQIPKVMALNLEINKKIAEARKSSNGNRDAAMEQIRELRKKYIEELNKILTRTQQVKFKKLQEKRKAERTERMEKQKSHNHKEGENHKH